MPAIIPDSEAGWMLRGLIRDLARRGESGGGARVTLRCSAVLLELHRADERHDHDHRSAIGSVSGETAKVEITVRQAAERLECSTRWITNRLVTGRIAGRRVGRMWLVDVASLDDYRHGRTDVPHDRAG